MHSLPLSLTTLALTLPLAQGTLAQQCPSDDVFEQNDTCASATVLPMGSYPALTAQDSDPDWYMVYVPPGRTLRASAIFSHGSGNIDATLEEPCGSQIAASTSITDDEEIVWTNTSTLGANPVFQVFLAPNSGADCNGYELRLTLDPITVTHGGLPHTTIGSAHLATDAVSGRLKVSNLGSSGCDGVRVSLGDVDGFLMDVAPFDLVPDGNNDDKGIRVTARGQNLGLPDQPLGELSGRIQGGQLQWTADFSTVGAMSYAMDVYQDDEYQGTISAANGGAITVYEDPAGICPDGFVWTSIGIICASPLGNPVDCGGTFCFLTMACVPVGPAGLGSGMWQGNTFYVYPVGNGGGGGGNPVYESAEVFVSSPLGDDELELGNEAVQKFDHTIAALDFAEMEGTPGKLKISNLGSSGCDGATIAAPDDTEELEADLVPLDLVSPNPIPPGAGYVFELMGEVLSNPMSVGEVEMTRNAQDEYELTANFLPLGTQTATVQVYDAGQLVAEVVGGMGVLARTTEHPHRATGHRRYVPVQVHAIDIGLGAGSSVSLDGLPPGTPVTGDLIRIFPENPITTPDDLVALRVCGRNLDEFQLEGVRSRRAQETGVEFCFGDGSGTPCPCGNPGQPGTGCANSSGLGARLIATGLPSQANDSLHFRGEGLTPSSFAVLVSANNALNNANGVQAFDGLRCVGGNLKRHGSRAIDANGNVDGWGPPNNPQLGLMAQGNFLPGDVRNFQIFYREMQTEGCGTGQNTSTAVQITFLP